MSQQPDGMYQIALKELGHPPLEPMAPLRDGATRREREMHEKLTAGRLRVEMARTCPDSVGVRRE
jgi:hypothetical protein